MITLNLTFEDLKQMRFAYSLLTEVILSFRALCTPSLYTTYAPWIEETRARLRGVNLDYMRALISPQGLVPDFLIPLPAIGMPNITDELHRLTSTSGDTVHAQASVIDHDWNPAPPIRQHFIDDPTGALAKLADTVDQYWQRALAPHWSRIYTSLEKDILFRARKLALHGAESLLNSLHPLVSLQDDQLTIAKPWQVDIAPAGNGFLLVPTLFARPELIFMHLSGMSIIDYRVRGANPWNGDHSAPSEALQCALGAGRAQVVLSLKQAATTTELAERLHLTPGAVSQHLSRLRQAGLVESQRSGGRVYYRHTARGKSLVELF